MNCEGNLFILYYIPNDIFIFSENIIFYFIRNLLPLVGVGLVVPNLWYFLKVKACQNQNLCMYPL